MIKRFFLALTFLLLLAASIVATAQYQWCPKCYVISWIDSPTSGATVPASGFASSGWGFVCEGGAAVDRVDVWYQKPDGYWMTLVQPAGSLATGLSRPDVRNAYLAHCPQVTANSGWYLFVSNTPPVGTRNMRFTIWRGPLYEGHNFTVTVQ